MSGEIYKTIDCGVNWNPNFTLWGMMVFKSVFFTGIDTGYVVGSDGIILKTINGGLPAGISEKPLTTESFKIYPNPSSSQITIETPTTPYKNTFMTIIDITGKELFTRQITEQQTVVDVSGLVSGVYLVRVSNDRTVIVGKFVKQ